MNIYENIRFDGIHNPGGAIPSDEDKKKAAEPPANQRGNKGLSIWAGGGGSSGTSKAEYAEPAVSTLFGTLFVQIGEDVHHEDENGEGSGNNSSSGT